MNKIIFVLLLIALNQIAFRINKVELNCIAQIFFF